MSSDDCISFATTLFLIERYPFGRRQGPANFDPVRIVVNEAIEVSHLLIAQIQCEFPEYLSRTITENEPICSSNSEQAGKFESRRKPRIQTLVSSSQRLTGVVIVRDFFSETVKFRPYLVGRRFEITLSQQPRSVPFRQLVQALLKIELCYLVDQCLLL